jgi:hypothetical protein
LSQGENILWYDITTKGEKDDKRVNSIRTLTNFRVLEYDYNSHIGKAKCLNDIYEFKLTNIFTTYNGIFKKEDVFGHFTDTNDAITDNNNEEKNKKTTSKTIGDIAFITREGTFMTFNKDTHIQIPKDNNTNVSDYKGLLCPQCMNSNPKDSTFCNKCGSKLVNTCQKCGNTNLKGSAFCNKCGFALE